MLLLVKNQFQSFFSEQGLSQKFEESQNITTILETICRFIILQATNL